MTCAPFPHASAQIDAAERLGVRVREVDDLAEQALYVATHKVLLVDRDLTADAREWAIGRALALVEDAS